MKKTLLIALAIIAIGLLAYSQRATIATRVMEKGLEARMGANMIDTLEDDDLEDMDFSEEPKWLRNLVMALSEGLRYLLRVGFVKRAVRRKLVDMMKAELAKDQENPLADLKELGKDLQSDIHDRLLEGAEEYSLLIR